MKAGHWVMFVMGMGTILVCADKMSPLTAIIGGIAICFGLGVIGLLDDN